MKFSFVMVGLVELEATGRNDNHINNHPYCCLQPTAHLTNKCCACVEATEAQTGQALGFVVQHKMTMDPFLSENSVTNSV